MRSPVNYNFYKRYAGGVVNGPKQGVDPQSGLKNAEFRGTMSVLDP